MNISFIPADRWKYLANAFSTSWTVSQDTAPGVYVERLDLQDDLLRVELQMRPDRQVARAVMVGQRGSGKSMTLAWLAARLSDTHLVLWVDTVKEHQQVLSDPLELFLTIGMSVYVAADKSSYVPDQQLFKTFVSACLDTTTNEDITDETLGVKLDQALANLAGGVAQMCLPVAIANPWFLLVGGAAACAQVFLQAAEIGASDQTRSQKTRIWEPQVDLAAARLSLFIHDIERRCGRKALVILDGLDRVEVPEVARLFERGRDLARPDVRLILTAPEVLYTSPAFDQLNDFIPLITLIPNLVVTGPNSDGYQFLYNVIQRRLAECGTDADDLFVPDVIGSLIEMSGGNIRQLVELVRQAILEAELAGETKISERSARAAIFRCMAKQIDPFLKADFIQALRDFQARPEPRLPDSGELWDRLLRSKCLLIYKPHGMMRFALNPLVIRYLVEEKLL